MDKVQGSKESKIIRQSKGPKQLKSRPFAVHTQWLIKMSYPLTDQAVIVGFHDFWKHKNEIFREYYKRFSLEDRKLLKQRAWICQQYGKRYLRGSIIELWYMHLILTMDYTVPNEPLVELQQAQLGPMLQRIYKTHDPNFKRPIFSQEDSSEQQLKKTPKGFFGCLAMIFNFFTKLQEKGETQIQEDPFITKQNQKHD